MKSNKLSVRQLYGSASIVTEHYDRYYVWFYIIKSFVTNNGILLMVALCRP